MPRFSPPSGCDGARIPKSCLPCAKLKARCETEAGVETCKRCQRLNRACISQRPGAHRRRKASPFNVAKREEKLNGTDATRAACRQTSIETDTAPSGLSAAAFIDHTLSCDTEGETILQDFRKDMEPLFPFVLTSPSMTFVALKEQKPLLVLAILMVDCRNDRIRQTTIAKKIREIISSDLLIKGEHNLDLLQCLLIYVNWYHFHLDLSSQVCNFVHLIMAVMTELALNKRISPTGFMPGFGRAGYFGKAGSVPNRAAPNPSATRTLEERRTFLGCFFLTSVTSMCIRDIEPLRYSRYADECCRILSEAAEYQTDTAVVHLTRLHGLADWIARAFPQNDHHMTPDFTSSPTFACVKTLEADLLRMESSFPEGTPHNALLSLHLYIVKIFLYEKAIDEADEPPPYAMYRFARLHMLHACLDSARLCFDAFHSIPLATLFVLPYTTWTSLGHAIVVLSKLSLFRTKDWDHAYMRSVLDFSECMDRLTQTLDSARALAESTRERDARNSESQNVSQLFSMLLGTLQRVKAVHEAMYTAQMKASGESTELLFESSGGTLTDDEMLMPSATFFSDFFTDDYWQHFM